MHLEFDFYMFIIIYYVFMHCTVINDTPYISSKFENLKQLILKNLPAPLSGRTFEPNGVGRTIIERGCGRVESV